MNIAHAPDPSAPAPLLQAWQDIDQAGVVPAARAVLRDLAWLLFAPPPVAQLPGDAPCWWSEAQWCERLRQLIAQPQPLLEVARHAPHRLGLYAEHLLAFWLASDAELQVLLRHHAVREGKLTLGDLDFVVRHPEHGVIHIELAVKYFLGLPPGNTLQHWVGTSLDDSLALKLQHMQRRQLPLSAHPGVERALGEGVRWRQAWLRGWLFHPLASQLQLPELHAEHCRGQWGTPEQILRQFDGSSPAFWLPLLQRLAPAQAPADTALPALHHLLQEWQQQERPWPRLLALMQIDQAQWVEWQRVWVVPPEWEQLATARLLSP